MNILNWEYTEMDIDVTIVELDNVIVTNLIMEFKRI